jgi:hypothetical protein
MGVSREKFGSPDHNSIPILKLMRMEISFSRTFRYRRHSGSPHEPYYSISKNREGASTADKKRVRRQIIGALPMVSMCGPAVLEEMSLFLLRSL